MLGRTIVALHGNTFVAGMPFSLFDIFKYEKGIAQVSEEMGNMTRAEVVAKGGFYIFLSPFDAITIPPGYLIFQCNTGNMNFNNTPSGTSGSDFLVPCFSQERFRFHLQ